MRLSTARGVAILFALALASVAVVPCACAEMSMAADSSAGHCNPVGSGLRAKVETACSCACITAQGEDSATPRVATVLARSISALPESHGVVPGSFDRVAVIRLRFASHSPPHSAPSILRI